MLLQLVTVALFLHPFDATIVEVTIVRQVEFKLICPKRKVFKARLILVYLN